ncbi:hypothetical protein PoB_003757400 [Plakobranchus ocellatus]|uniref:Uncharacterized protein n=1 Tax=Plakobranchus ocellatus TaxID=259542 RepID=A0AAV4AY62_9GAST|nr:hypothetical protein PoB_003757400 [Plakobranchus ocellatus]
MSHATPNSSHGPHYDPLSEVKRNSHEVGSARCCTELKQNEFQSQEIPKPVCSTKNNDASFHIRMENKSLCGRAASMKDQRKGLLDGVLAQ